MHGDSYDSRQGTTVQWVDSEYLYHEGDVLEHATGVENKVGVLKEMAASCKVNEMQAVSVCWIYMYSIACIRTLTIHGQMNAVGIRNANTP